MILLVFGLLSTAKSIALPTLFAFSSYQEESQFAELILATERYERID